MTRARRPGPRASRSEPERQQSVTDSTTPSVLKLPRIGTRESQTLEFKAAEILRSPKGRRHLLREIVGMLNTEAGGRILIGLRERDGAFAGVDPLGEDDRKLEDNLRDALLDAIEPRIQAAECELTWIPVPEGLVLEVRVRPRRPGPSPPFCLRHGEDRIYLLRVQDRLRGMSYDELRPAGAGDPEGPESWFPSVCEEAATWFDIEEQPSFFLLLGLQPKDGREELRLPDDAPQLVNHPPREIARPDGWTFATAFQGNAAWGKGGRILRSGDPEQGYRQIRATHDGRLAFRTLLDHLQWNLPEDWQRQRPAAPGMLYPQALVESTVAVLRLATELWKDHLHDADLHASLRLSHTKGWLLPPYGPTAVQYLHVEYWHATEEESIASGPHRMEAESIAERPDALAKILLTDVYAEFEYWPENIPGFDPATGKGEAPRR